MRGIEKNNIKRGKTDKQTDRQIYILTLRLYESIGPEGRCFEKNLFVKTIVMQNVFRKSENRIPF